MSQKNYYEPLPVDFELLTRMPDQGTIGGVHWKGKHVKDLRGEILDAANGDLTPDMLTADMVSARMRSMLVAGLVQNYPAMGAGGLRIWARTPKGVEFLNANKSTSEEQSV
jgi:hypothetical protein